MGAPSNGQARRQEHELNQILCQAIFNQLRLARKLGSGMDVVSFVDAVGVVVDDVGGEVELAHDLAAGEAGEEEGFDGGAALLNERQG